MMSMEKYKQISLKIDPWALEVIDGLACRCSYLKRNTIINSILRAAVRCADDDSIADILNASEKDLDDYKLKFSKK